ncbi:MAG TPA: hypothetical protein VIT90_17040 [Lysobacter sp.]
MKTKPAPPDVSHDQLRAINADLLDLIETQRTVYSDILERTLLTLAARGNTAAASALLVIREVFADADVKAKEHVRAMRRAMGEP